MLTGIPYGEMTDDGQITRDTKTCAMTGRPIEPGDVFVRVKGMQFFFRVRASAKSLLTDEARSVLETGIREQYAREVEAARVERERVQAEVEAARASEVQDTAPSAAPKTATKKGE